MQMTQGFGEFLHRLERILAIPLSADSRDVESDPENKSGGES